MMRGRNAPGYAFAYAFFLISICFVAALLTFSVDATVLTLFARSISLPWAVIVFYVFAFVMSFDGP